MKNMLEGIGGCAALLYFLSFVWILVRAAWEKFWYGEAVSLAETTARGSAYFASPQTGIPTLLLGFAVYLVAGAGLYLLIAVFLWAQKQWEPEAPTIAEQDEELPGTDEEWEELLDAAAGHTHEGRPICQRCGEPIPEGEETLLTDNEKRSLLQGRGVKSLPGAFRHINAAECGKPT